MTKSTGSFHALRCTRRLIAFALGLSATAVLASTTTVSSVSALQTAINAAVPGDTIVMTNGTYTTSGSITVKAQGTASAPILILAQSIGGVTIGGSGALKFAAPAAWVTVEGFVFTHGGTISIPFGTSHIRLTRNIIQLTIASGATVSYVGIAGDDVEIDHNEIRNKSTLGEMLDISGSGTQVANRLWVHHNYFHDFSSPGGNGAETIRWGLSGLSLSNGYGVCEYNLFVRCQGENEAISNKSSSNIYRYNTFLDMPGGQLSQRHGNFNLIYGNYFKNTDGIRIYGDNNQIFSNYLEGNVEGIDIGNGDGEVEAGADLTSHDKPDNTVIVFNTLLNNSRQYFMAGRTGGLGAANTTFANNIVVGGPTAASISSNGPYTGAVWAGNIIWNTTPGNLPAGTYTVADPQLVADASGVFHISATSPAINASVGYYPNVNFDMDGQLRDSYLDVGADEFSAGQIMAHMLTTADVGPAAIGDQQPPPPLQFEAENLPFVATGANATITTETGSSGGAFASNLKYVSLGADGIPPPPNGEYVDFTLPAIPQGTYDLLVRYKSNSSGRGVARIFVDGVQVGSDLNELASSATYREPYRGTLHLSGGTHVIRLAVAAGNTTTVNGVTTTSYTVNADRFTLVPDSTPPVIGSLPDLTIEATGPAGAIVAYATNAFDDKDGSVPVAFTPPSGSVFALGTNLVVATAQDYAGNVGVASFEVNVVDTTPPALTLPSAITAEATGPDGAAVSFAPIAHDIVSGDVPVVCTPPSGSAFPLGTTTVNAIARDGAGNASTGSFTVTVRDTTPPALTLPPNLIVEATSPAGAPATFSATALDLVSGACPISYSQDPGTTFPLGTTTVTVTSSDQAGNTATGSFTVTVRDTTAPVISAPSATPATLTPPNHKLVPVTITATAHDAVDPSPSTHIISVTSNEPINGAGDGNTSPDYEITGNLTLNLRAERSGNGSDRVYTIIVESRDFSGNASTASVNVTVPHDQRK